MAVEPDPYVVLGVAPTATDAEIRAAYLAQVARYHPDLHQGNPLEELASQKMREINRAHDLVSDPARRAAYDQRRGQARGDARAARPPGFPPGIRRQRWGKLIPILVALPFLLRFAVPAVRGVGVLGREVIEGLSLLRGTPFVAAGVLLAVVGLLFALSHRRRAKAPGAPNNRK